MKLSTRMVVLGRKLWTPAALGLWTPAALGSSLALWLDADDFSTITLNGSTVSQWRDKSGNGRHASQADVANQPTYTANGLNGKPELTFDGLTQFLNLPVSGAPTQNSSLIGVFQTTNAEATFAGFINIMADVVPEKHEIRLGVGTGGSQTFYRAYWNGAYVTIDNAAVNFQNLSVFNVSFVTSGGVTTTTVRVNGSNALSASRGGTWGDTVEFTIGRFVRNGAMRAGIAQELISIQSVLSTTDIQKLEGYLAHKRGSTADLPSDHLFKFTPPYI
jgi:hypothetical protein